MLISVPTIAWTMSFHIKNIEPTLSWADVHYNFDLVFKLSYAQVEAMPAAHNATLISSWLPLVASFVYFLCFGMHDGVTSRAISAYHGTLSLHSKLRG